MYCVSHVWWLKKEIFRICLKFLIYVVTSKLWLCTNPWEGGKISPPHAISRQFPGSCLWETLDHRVYSRQPEGLRKNLLGFGLVLKNLDWSFLLLGIVAVSSRLNYINQFSQWHLFLVMLVTQTRLPVVPHIIPITSGVTFKQIGYIYTCLRLHNKIV